MAQHDSQTPLDSRDLWSTPKWLFKWLNSYYHFGIDLASTNENKKCAYNYTQEQNSLSKNWFLDSAFHEYNPVGFLNPPYSNIAPWVTHSVLEAKRRFTTVMVIPTPNGESYYSDLLENASEIVFIDGRVSFVASCDFEKISKSGKITKVKKGDEVSGNTRGTCVVEFSKTLVKRDLRIGHVDRDFLISKFGE